MSRHITLMGIVLVLLISNTYAKSPPPGTGQADVKANILFMVDDSGSMGASAGSQMDLPMDVAVNSKGEVFVVERWRYLKVFKRTNDPQNGNMEQIKSFGSWGRCNTCWQYGWKLSIDEQDNVYIADRGGNRILKYNSQLKWQKTFTGIGRPENGVDTDSDLNVYAVSRRDSGGTIYKWDKNGTLLTSWTLSNANGISVYEGPYNTGTSTLKNAVAVGATSIEVDSAAGFPPVGVITIAADGTNAAETVPYSGISGNTLTIPALAIAHATGATVTADDDYVYVGDYNWRNDNIHQFALNGVKLTRSGWREFKQAQTQVYDVEVTDDGVYALMTGQNRVYKWDHVGTFERHFGVWKNTGHDAFDTPMGLGSHPGTGEIYVAQRGDNAVNIWNKFGTYVNYMGEKKTRMTEALKVIRALVTDDELTKGAKFGLMEWNSRATMTVNVGPNGFNNIRKRIDDGHIRPGGGTNLDNAMTLARSYFRGGNSPMDPQAKCEKNFLIVLSDGSWTDRVATGIAADLLARNGIKTFVVGFMTGGNSNYVKLAKGGGTHPDSPLYTSKWEELYSTLASYIRSAISSRLTFTTPFIMPSVSSDDAIYQSTFSYKEKNQWEGALVKYKLKADGKLGAKVWDAGKLLNAKSASARKIWTVGKGLGAGMNNFILGNKTALRPLLWGEAPPVEVTDAMNENLIKFVRGLDAFDEDKDNSFTDERWKLADIYHSEINVVDKPNAKMTDDIKKVHTEAYYRHSKNYTAFKGQQANRKTTVYAGSNGGMLHAFDADSGEELWGFIPPNVLQELQDMTFQKPVNTTQAQYYVDGSPTVKDVFVGGKWMTMLICGLGRGGFGYFALDVTNRNNPKFLWAFSNEPITDKVYYWSSNGTKTTYDYANNKSVAKEYDFSKLGKAYSTPVIVLSGTGLKRKWVAAFGGGFNAGSAPEYGSAVYIIDLEADGKIIKTIDLTDSAGGYANSMPSTLSAITPDTTSVAKYTGAMLYGVDLESKLWKINLTNSGAAYDASILFDGEGTDKNMRASFFPVNASIGTDAKLWLYWGTGDQQSLQIRDASIQNRIFAIRDKDFPKYKKTGAAGTVAQCANTTGQGKACPKDTDLGWYVNLKTDEKVTGAIAVHNEVLYVSRYTPKANNPCKPGTGTLSEHGYGCGKTDKETDLGSGILTGAVIYKGQIYVGISGASENASGNPGGNQSFTQHGSIIIGKPNKTPATDATVSQESWRELY